MLDSGTTNTTSSNDHDDESNHKKVVVVENGTAPTEAAAPSPVEEEDTTAAAEAAEGDKPLDENVATGGGAEEEKMEEDNSNNNDTTTKEAKPTEADNSSSNSNSNSPSNGDAMDLDEDETKVKAESAVEEEATNGDKKEEVEGEKAEEDVEMKDASAVKEEEKEELKDDNSTKENTENNNNNNENSESQMDEEKKDSQYDNDDNSSSSSNNNNEEAEKEEAKVKEEEPSSVKQEEEEKKDGEKSNSSIKPEEEAAAASGATNTAAEATAEDPVPAAEASTAAAEAPAPAAEASATEAPAAGAAPPPDAAATPPPPVLKGTLSYSIELRKHQIRGMWNYEHSSAFPPQRFELVRTLNADEDITVLPKDGEFHGSFSLAYVHTTSKGKQKERSKVIPESGVNIKFTPVEGTEKEYKVDGKGTNQFGIFHINGTATPSTHEDDPSFNIVLRKRYEPAQQPPPAGSGSAADMANNKKRKSVSENGMDGSFVEGPLPPPSQSFEQGVVCLRGKLYKEEAYELGATDQVHRIHGMWANGLNLILADPQNVQGHCNRFEYEHKSTVPNNTFPVSGRYSGWFDLTSADGSKTKINERDVVLRFQKNSAGYHNVEGRGANAFGRYSITGTLSLDNVITIFRQFKPIKTKTKVTSAPPPINKGGQAGRRPSSQQAFPEPRLKMEDVKIPNEDKPGEIFEPITPPDHSAYSAVSRGVLKLSEDGSHTCAGKWAVTREHFTSGQTSPFSFRLEAHFALEAAEELKKKKQGGGGDGDNTKNKEEEEAKKKEGEEDGATTAAASTAVGTPVIPEEFPLDSAMYKGSFQLKKGGSRYQTIVDHQIVMKFRMNKQGAYNVYGRGQNAIGTFNLIGTLIMRGKTSGQVELYRVYPPEHLAAPPVKVQGTANAQAPGKVPTFPKPATSTDVAPLADANMPKTQPVPSSSTILPGPPRGGQMVRRESSRLVKLPSHLVDDDPKAQLNRIMQKCSDILRQLREKDLEHVPYFSDPVDPVALGIPTYFTVISEPMDLGTIAKKLENNQLESPEEFARLTRLVFENAITFNVDPTNYVHQAARSLLVFFNQRFRDVERMVENLRRNNQGSLDVDGKKKKNKDDKKRKRSDEPKSLKRRRHDEVQAMSTENANAMAAIVAAAPKGVPNASVSRGEFNMMIHMIQLLQKQIVQTHTALAELSPGDETDTAATAATTVSAYDSYAVGSTAKPAAAPAPGPERKKSKKKASEPAAPKKQQQQQQQHHQQHVVEEPAIVFDETKPLTLQEQETLTETINNMPPDHIPGVIQIIRESASLAGDEDEIDLEIDQLDTVTQRRLLRHVSKYIKQPKRSKSKGPKKAKASAPAPAPKPAQKKAAEKPAAKKPPSPKKSESDPGSFFAAFGSKGDSDSDSDDDDDDEPQRQTISNTPSGGKQLASAASSKSDGFDLGDGFGGLHDDNDDDLGDGGITANWNLSKAVAKDTDSDKHGDDEEWGAAKKHAAAQEAREADRKKREEKLKAEAEETKKQRLADAAKQSELLKAQRAEEEANEQQKKLAKEKEAKEAQEKARAEMRKQVESVEQTVDLDAQRDIMKQYEQSFLDKELGSASPSSDFGF